MYVVTIAFALAGILLIIASATLWSGRPKRVALNAVGENRTQIWRAGFLIVWTLSLPLYSLVELIQYGAPAASDLAAVQYRHKVLSDIWTAVAVSLGLLFGIRKF